MRHRKAQHLATSKRDSSVSGHFYNAINKYGEENFEWKIIEYCSSQEEMNIKESFWIDFFDTTNSQKGYNLKGGGHVPFLTEEVKRKIGDAQKGELNHMYGRTGKDNPSSKRVINLTTNEIFDSVEDLCRNNPWYGHSKVCAVCRGDRKTHKGCVFRYLDDDGNIIENSNKIEKVRILINLQTQERFTRVSYAFHKYKREKQSMSNLYTKLKETGVCRWNNYIWYFEDVDISKIDINNIK